MVIIQSQEYSVPLNANDTTATYRAFCSNYGDHCTNAVGSHNWNEEAIEKMIGSLAAPWQNLRLTLQNWHDNITASIEDLMDWAIQYLGNS
jgi:hypothetical protein